MSFRTLALAFAAVALGFSAPRVFAEGEDNVTGVTGPFNGTVTTGGGYDPYTGNAFRTVPDLALPSVSEIPLVFSRTFLSRSSDDPTSFGQGGTWRHSFEWKMTDNAAGNNTPTAYRIVFPDGRDITFTAVAGQTWWRGPLGTSERLEFVDGNRVSEGGLMRLHLGDGSKVEFEYYAEDVTYWSAKLLDYVESYKRHFQAARLIDRHTRVTSLTYDGWVPDGGTGLLLRVTEPAGRFIDIRWAQVNSKWVVAELESSNRGTWAGGGATPGEKVNYGYTTMNGYNTLTAVTYHYDRYLSGGNWTSKTAVYTYMAPPGYTAQAPLLATAVDPRFPGAMTRIKYDYWSNMGKGFLKSESYYGTGPSDPDLIVSKLDVPNANTRVETRGDGPSNTGPQRTFTYSNGRLAFASTFRSSTEKSSYTYLNGFLRRVVDSEGRATTYTRESVLGAVTQVLNEADNTTIGYTYTSTQHPYFVATVTNERGKVTTFTRNGRGQVTNVAYPTNGGSETTYYADDGKFYLPTSRITRSGATFTYYYGESAYLGSSAWSFEDNQQVNGALQSIDPSSLLTRVRVAGTDVPADEQRISFYDIWGRVVRTRDARGYDELFDFDRAGRATKQTHDGTAHAPATVHFSSTGVPTTAGNADNTYTLREYDGFGNLVRARNEAAKWTTTTYDAFRRPLVVTDATSRSTTMIYRPNSGAYDAMSSTFAQAGVIILPGDTPTAPRQIHSYFTPDRWLQQRYTGANTIDSAWVQYSYNSVGQVREAWDSAGRASVETTYDGRGRVYEVFDPQNNRTWHEYDEAGNLRFTHLPDGKQIEMTYDDLNRVLTAKDQLGQTTTKTYYPDGSVQTLVDPRGKTYSFSIDGLGRRRTMTYPSDGNNVVRTETTTYGLGGYVAARKDRNDATWGLGTDKFVFDHRGRMYLQPAPQNAAGQQNFPREFNYDEVGRVTRLTNWNTNQVTWGYDDAGRMTWECQYHSDINQAKTVGFQYDAAGRLEHLVYPNAWTRVDYTYNGRDQISYLGTGIAGGGHIMGASFGYALDGQMNRISRLQGTETFMTFDSNGRIESHVHKLHTGVEFASRHYTYDSMNRLIGYQHGTSGGVNTPEDGRNTMIGYSDDGQVNYVEHDRLNPTFQYGRRQEVFRHDANGNRMDGFDSLSGYRVHVHPSSPGQGLPDGWNDFRYETNDLNQYTVIQKKWQFGTPEAPQVPGYDANGNLTSYEGWTYTTNSESKITQMSGPTGTMTVHYDPLGRPFLREFPDGTKRRYYYAGQNVIEEWDGQTPSQPRAVHVHAPGVDHVLGTMRFGVNGPNPPLLDHYYRLYDVRNSVTHVVLNDANLTVQAYRYDTFGKPFRYAADGTFYPVPSGPDENRYLFTGREWFPEVAGGLYDYRARAFHPRLGRFLQADPTGMRSRDNNIYRYCKNNPVGFFDPTGNDGEPVQSGLTLSVGVSANGVLGIGGGIGGGVFVTTDPSVPFLDRFGIYGTPSVSAGVDVSAGGTVSLVGGGFSNFVGDSATLTGGALIYSGGIVANLEGQPTGITGSLSAGPFPVSNNLSVGRTSVVTPNDLVRAVENNVITPLTNPPSPNTVLGLFRSFFYPDAADAASSGVSTGAGTFSIPGLYDSSYLFFGEDGGDGFGGFGGFGSFGGFADFGGMASERVPDVFRTTADGVSFNMTTGSRVNITGGSGGGAPNPQGWMKVYRKF